VGISSAISGAIIKYLGQFPDFSFCIFGGDAEAILEIMDSNSKKRLQFEPDSIGQGILKALVLSKDSNR
jgi:hypothetical protein